MNANEVQSQLDECFAVVFPELTAFEIRQATMESVEMWDSLATLTLVGVVEETFQIRIPLDELPNLISYAAVSDFLTRPARAAA